MLNITLIIVALFVLIVGSYTDLKWLEVPDWLNYAGIVSGIGIHLIWSLQQWSLTPILSSLAGFGIGFVIAAIMFYTGQWGGGDAKLLMAIGAIIGFTPGVDGFLFGFIINLIIMGAVWGLIFSIGLALRKRKIVWATFKSLKNKKQYKKLRQITLGSVLFLLVASFFMRGVQDQIIGLAFLSWIMCQFVILAKSVELVCMHKWITPDLLTEGDWLIHAVKIGSQTVEPPKLGLEKKELGLLQKWYKEKKIDTVLVKYGVPFVPSFLLAFLLTMWLGNFVINLLPAL